MRLLHKAGILLVLLVSVHQLYFFYGSLSEAQTSTKFANEPTNDDSLIVDATTIPRNLDYCSSNSSEHNFMVAQSLSRRGSIPNLINAGLIRAVPFSLRRQDFLVRAGRHACKTAHELTEAIRLGQRRWDDEENVTAIARRRLDQRTDINKTDEELMESLFYQEMQAFPSMFEPHGCDIPILSRQDDYCRILSKFQQVLWLGDSLSRHTLLGFAIGISNDMRSGALQWDRRENPAQFEQCQCDGQFSEHLHCRKTSPERLNSLVDTTLICPSSAMLDGNDASLKQSPKPPTVKWNHFPNPPGKISRFMDEAMKGLLNSEMNDDRPLLLILQGGSHLRTFSKVTHDRYLRQVLNHPAIKAFREMGKKVILIWINYSTIGYASWKRYRHQSPNCVLQFNREMVDLWQNSSTYHNIRVLDYVNLTQGAFTSDGVHFALNVNYFKAQYQLVLADLMLQEGLFFSK